MAPVLAAALLAAAPATAAPGDPGHTVTIWVHGFDTNGAGRHGTYGDDLALRSATDSLAALVGLPTIEPGEAAPPPDVVAATTYYGDTPPAYYSAADVADVDGITAQYGGGVPRYALIVAKYARQLLRRSGASQANLVSASFGSLVARWMIEKDVEGLASEGRIARWLTAEGVLCGNWAASRPETMKLLDLPGIDLIDLVHMSYGWIEANLHSPRTEADNPLLAGILIGQMGSTDDRARSASLSVAMAAYGEFAPNDGVQALPDAYFHDVTAASRLLGLPPTLSLYHVGHFDLAGERGAWVQLASFLTQRRRVTVTMTSAQVFDLHEIALPFWDWRPAEITFESRVYSPLAQALWGISEPLSTCEKDGAAAPLRLYRQKGETRSFRQVVYDDFVMEGESDLVLELHADEIDHDWRYGVFETTQTPSYDAMGAGTIRVSTRTPGTYAFNAGDWACTLEVGVVEYPFGTLAHAVGVGEAAAPGGPVALALWPNPFSSSVRIAVSGLAPSVGLYPARLTIRDLSGRSIRRMEGDAGAGFVWDGRDDSGRPVPPGVYLHRLETEGRALDGRSLLLR
ncbi:MAG TPA: hypothetical protein VGK89_01915 [Candidatus Eisenbacteria bacterium]|jgi:hypothetical protein